MNFNPRNNGVQNTFLFHDFETGGLSTSYDRPMQFAAIRTDQDLNPIGDPINIHCKVSDDYLPSPEACVITGISPYECEEKGLSEADFSKAILKELGKPGTCGVGYNSLKYDDNVTRNLLFRTMEDPYRREWANNNSRWDILPLIRAVFAFCPSVMKFPTDETGKVNFRLENLAEVNGLIKTRAHDALSDVETTIALARLIKEKVPKLFDYYYSLRIKKTVQNKFDMINHSPVLYVTSMAGVEKGLVSPIMPVVAHPEMFNVFLCIDLSKDLGELLNIPASDLAHRMYPKDGEERIPVFKVFSNQSPFIASPAQLKALEVERIGLDFDRELANHNYKLVKANLALLKPKLQQIASLEPKFPLAKDAEGRLFEGFASDSERARMTQLTRLNPDEMLSALEQEPFDSSTYNDLMFRYVAKNWPEALNEQQLSQWHEFVKDRLLTGGPAQLRTFEDFFKRIEELKVDAKEDQLAILVDLEKWGVEKKMHWFPSPELTQAPKKPVYKP